MAARKISGLMLFDEGGRVSAGGGSRGTHIVPGEWNVVLRSGWIALRLRKHELEFDRPLVRLFNLLDDVHHILFRA